MSLLGVDHLLSTLSERQACVIKMRFGLQDGNLYTHTIANWKTPGGQS